MFSRALGHFFFFSPLCWWWMRCQRCATPSLLVCSEKADRESLFPRVRKYTHSTRIDLSEQNPCVRYIIDLRLRGCEIGTWKQSAWSCDRLPALWLTGSPTFHFQFSHDWLRCAHFLPLYTHDVGRRWCWAISVFKWEINIYMYTFVDNRMSSRKSHMKAKKNTRQRQRE